MSFKVMIGVAALWAFSAVAQTTAREGGAVSSGTSIGSPVSPSGGNANLEGTNGKRVIGKPLSATEERRTVQILADGARIENNQTNKFYRDEEGRTRVQYMDGSGVISDPEQGVPDQVSPDGSLRHNLPARYLGPPPTEPNERGPSAKREPTNPISEEDLGSQLINGVIAHGSRTTTTIPVGQIGNDQPIRIVAERWYSPDLEMNIKTVDSDPRTGETTYQLTNIHQGVQDPALFRHPTPGRPQR